MARLPLTLYQRTQVHRGFGHRGHPSVQVGSATRPYREARWPPKATPRPGTSPCLPKHHNTDVPRLEVLECPADMQSFRNVVVLSAEAARRHGSVIFNCDVGRDVMEGRSRAVRKEGGPARTGRYVVPPFPKMRAHARA
jgi:hypothetical protein